MASALNPFKRIPTIMTADEIIEFAHSKSKKLSMKSSKEIKKVPRAKIREYARLAEFGKQIKSKLKESVEGFPTIDRLHPFYLELTEILVGTDKLKKSLGAVYSCLPPIEQILRDHLEALKLTEDAKQMKKTRSAAKGRIASIIRATSKNIDFLIEAKKKLASLPGILVDSPTIVCAGFPNVGKSTLVREVSTAEPEIAYYPFTTKNVIIGHLKIRDYRVQIVDTPGILDRPMSKRNEIERQAITALKYLAHVIVFIIDPSEACGWSIDDQMNLLREVQRMFPIIPILIAFNKIDITFPEKLEEARKLVPNAYEITATDGTGVPELLQDAVDEVDLDSLQDSIAEHVASLKKRKPDTSD
ncbi:MAG: 50S ribosome-binding GTPase [Candidatus Thorarchaeota archaeon]|nr:50S ribosome-binding GTPase [Candidatus Thorarchaeota archaeon]